MQDPDHDLSTGPNGERIFFSMEAKMHNDRAIDQIRTLLTIIGGCAAGVLGCTGTQGLVMFVVTYLAVSITLVVCMGFDTKQYTALKLHMFLFDGASKYGLSFVLFWTLIYALIYIY